MKKLSFLLCLFAGAAATLTAGAVASPVGDPRAADTTVTMVVVGGWNMISLPLITSETHKDSLFPTSSSNAFYFDDGYVADDSLDRRKGYWLKFAGDDTVSLFGTAVHADTIGVIEGWNLVGSISDPIDTGAVTTVPAGITLSRFWGYDVGTGYVHAQSIVPGAGYWVKASSAGGIVLDAAAIARPRAAKDPSAGLNTLVIEDARGMRQTLRFGEMPAGAVREDEEMPPPPPGLFDARFAGGAGVEYYPDDGEGRFTAMVSSAIWPVTVRWEMADGDGRAITLNGSVKMTGTGSAVIETRGPIEITAGAPTAPAKYSLRQNYPNPFNPATKISFDLPEQTEIRLTLYDMLGRRVAVLAEGGAAPGTHTVDFDATGHPSGLYFYKLEAGRFSETRKMTILK